MTAAEPVLRWERADSDDAGDQRADSGLAAHAYWSLGPAHDGWWVVELVVLDDDGNEILDAGTDLGEFAEEAFAKDAADTAERAAHPRPRLALTHTADGGTRLREVTGAAAQVLRAVRDRAVWFCSPSGGDWYLVGSLRQPPQPAPITVTVDALTAAGFDVPTAPHLITPRHVPHPTADLTELTS